MAYRLVTTTAKVATAQDISPDGALRHAREAWDSGQWLSVRLEDAEGMLLWKRGATGSPETEARDRERVTAAVGLSQLRLDRAEIHGLADLAEPLDPFARTLEVRTGAKDTSGLLEADLGPPSVRDLLHFLDTRLEAPATLHDWAVEAAAGVNPGHKVISVTLEDAPAAA
ncbi:MAG: hypothetical protein AAGB05_18600 [Pseudomonadota bacterium]